MPDGKSTFRFGEFSLDTGARELRRGEQRIELQRKAFDVLTYLLRHLERAVPKSALLD